MAQAPGKEGAVAPQERVNIRYRTESGGAVEETELPLRLLVTGDFTGRPDATLLEERNPINIDKNNFDEVLSSQRIGLTLQVDNTLSGKSDEKLAVDLNFASMKDFEPESIAQQIPALRELLELREALTELKGPLSQNADFRKRLQKLLDDETARSSILDEIGLGSSSP